MTSFQRVSCPECDRRYKVRAADSDRRIRCRECGHTIVVTSGPIGEMPAAVDDDPPSKNHWIVFGVVSVVCFLAFGIGTAWYLSRGRSDETSNVVVQPDKTPAVSPTVPVDTQSPAGPATAPPANVPVFEVGPYAVQEVKELEQLQFKVPISLKGSNDGTVTFRFAASVPEGIQLHPKTGLLTWKPNEEQGPGAYSLPVTAYAEKFNLEKTVEIKIAVAEVNSPPIHAGSRGQNRVLSYSVAAGQVFTKELAGQDRDAPANKLTYSLRGPVPAGAEIDPQSGRFTWSPKQELIGDVMAPFDVVVSDDGDPPLSDTIAFRLIVTPSRSVAKKNKKRLPSPKPTRVARVSGSSKKRVAAKTPGGKKRPDKPGSTEDGCDSCTGNAIVHCRAKRCKNGYITGRGAKQMCGGCLGFGRVPCPKCPVGNSKRADFNKNIKDGNTLYGNMQKLYSRLSVVVSSIQTLNARNRSIDRQIDDEDTSVSEVGRLARERANNEFAIRRYQSEIPPIQRTFQKVKSGLLTVIQTHGVFLGQGQTSDFQKHNVTRMNELLTRIRKLN